jgi:hypothetical protein
VEPYPSIFPLRSVAGFRDVTSATSNPQVASFRCLSGNVAKYSLTATIRFEMKRPAAISRPNPSMARKSARWAIALVSRAIMDSRPAFGGGVAMLASASRDIRVSIVAAVIAVSFGLY